MASQSQLHVVRSKGSDHKAEAAGASSGAAPSSMREATGYMPVIMSWIQNQVLSRL
jgi:hypothetical protein